MLFDDQTNFHIQFPQPQYLGAKVKLLQWIYKHLPKNINSALDAFGGSQSVAFLFKQMGLKTYTNDFLNFNHQIGLALIENNFETLTQADVKILLQDNPSRKSLIKSNFTGVFFEEGEADFLDNFRSNIPKLENKYKQSLAFSIINRSLTRKVTMGHFAHLQALNYAQDPERIKRNPNLVKPIKKIFLELLPEYNQAVFDNKQDNQSFNQNILDLLPKLKNEKIDLVYFDPPYTDSHSDYQAFYHLLETFTEYWEDKEFINGTKRYFPPRFSGFDKKTDVLDSLHNLFDSAQNIPYWVISWNNRSYPEVSEFTKILEKYKKVGIHTKKYQNSQGGKGSVKGSEEVLFVCTEK